MSHNNKINFLLAKAQPSGEQQFTVPYYTDDYILLVSQVKQDEKGSYIV